MDIQYHIARSSGYRDVGAARAITQAILTRQLYPHEVRVDVTDNDVEAVLTEIAAALLAVD